jgi:hypothetical protein
MNATKSIKSMALGSALAIGALLAVGSTKTARDKPGAAGDGGDMVSTGTQYTDIPEIPAQFRPTAEICAGALESSRKIEQFFMNPGISDEERDARLSQYLRDTGRSQAFMGVIDASNRIRSGVAKSQDQLRSSNTAWEARRFADSVKIGSDSVLNSR